MHNKASIPKTLYLLAWKGIGASQSLLGLIPTNLWETLCWSDRNKSQEISKMGLPHEVPYVAHCFLSELCVTGAQY